LTHPTLPQIITLLLLFQLFTERLNRMWQGNNVTFYQPQVAADDDDDAEGEESELEWFHLFALHQNRDVGRGKKNCINESMIPEWMDCVVW
jgi:double-strand break repair protein MRE11